MWSSLAKLAQDWKNCWVYADELTLDSGLETTEPGGNSFDSTFVTPFVQLLRRHFSTWLWFGFRWAFAIMSPFKHTFLIVFIHAVLNTAQILATDIEV